jgi:hypothetical protein
MANGCLQILEYKSTFAFSVKKYPGLLCISKLAFQVLFCVFLQSAMVVCIFHVYIRGTINKNVRNIIQHNINIRIKVILGIDHTNESVYSVFLFIVNSNILLPVENFFEHPFL